MLIRVLGCHGGETPRHLPIAMLLDAHVAIDAGSLCRALELSEQNAIDDVLIGHAHMDHVKDLALLAEQSLGSRERPIQIHCGPQTAQILAEHYFNGRLWPDFTRLPSKAHPAVRIKRHAPGRKFSTQAGHQVTFVQVEHPVESMGMIIEGEGGAFVYSSDTGPTEALWRRAAKLPGLCAVFMELSFPNLMQDLATVAGHLTPFTLSSEIAKMPDGGYPIFLYHLKPAHMVETRRELRALRQPRLQVLTPGDRFEI